MKFKRSACRRPTTLPRWRLKLDEVEINDAYWATRFAQTNTAVLAKPGLTVAAIADALVYKSDALNSLGHTAQELERRLKVAQRWHRLMTLVSTTSALERYIDAVAAIALASDPLLQPGWPKRLDGLAVNKFGLSVPASPDLVGLTKGEWGQRAQTYEDLFGSLPDALSSHLPDLEQMRKMRNAVAHGFAGSPQRHLSAQSELLLSIRRADGRSPSQSLSHERLLKWLGVAKEVADAIDTHLLSNFIGDYEVASIYQEWRLDPAKFELGVKAVLLRPKASPQTRFARAMGDYFPNMGIEYLKTMQVHIDALT